MLNTNSEYKLQPVSSMDLFPAKNPESQHCMAKISTLRTECGVHCYLQIIKSHSQIENVFSYEFQVSFQSDVFLFVSPLECLSFTLWNDAHCDKDSESVLFCGHWKCNLKRWDLSMMTMILNPTAWSLWNSTPAGLIWPKSWVLPFHPVLGCLFYATLWIMGTLLLG